MILVTETPTAPDEAETQAPPRPRGRQTVGDMVRSMALVLAVVAVVLLLTLRDEPTQEVREIGYSAQLDETRAVASYDVLAPVGLGSGWKATSARGRSESGDVTWHLGLVTPDGEYAAVEQSDGPRKAFVDDHAAGGEDAGQVVISGGAWQRIEGGKPETRALLLRGDGVTTMVAGSASWSELTRLARSLSAG
jgi:hypothetical protein